MRLIITRHGETVHNVQGVVQGHIHGKLTETGKEQARKLGKTLQNENIDYIYSSDLGRAKQTTQEISKFHPEANVVYDKRLRERDYKKYAGKHKDDINWDEVENATAEHIEPLEEVRNRLKNFFEDLIEEHPKDTILLVSHGTASRILIGLIRKKSIEESLQMKMENTSLNIIEIKEDNNHKIHVLNSTDHL